jgi:L-iditol 2-dehydrogenase
VIISEPSPTRRQLAQSFRMEALIDPSSEDVVASVRKLTGGLGADIVICANPVAATQTQAVELVRKAGKVILFGGLPKAAPLATLDANRIHYGEITVVGSFSYHPRFHAQAIDVLRRNLIPVEALVTHTFPLAAIAQAFTTAAGGEALKVMVAIN